MRLKLRKQVAVHAHVCLFAAIPEHLVFLLAHSDAGAILLFGHFASFLFSENPPAGGIGDRGFPCKCILTSKCDACKDLPASNPPRFWRNQSVNQIYFHFLMTSRGVPGHSFWMRPPIRTPHNISRHDAYPDTHLLQYCLIRCVPGYASHIYWSSSSDPAMTSNRKTAIRSPLFRCLAAIRMRRMACSTSLEVCPRFSALAASPAMETQKA